MSSGSRLLVVALVVTAAGAASGVRHTWAAAAAPLRVCADPNNLPFSNDRQEGFENKLANLIARELGRKVEYFWAPQRRGFFRTTLSAGRCDVVMSVPTRLERALPTKPYYRSTYVFL